jgi:hypothetical protein
MKPRGGQFGACSFLFERNAEKHKIKVPEDVLDCNTPGCLREKTFASVILANVMKYFEACLQRGIARQECLAHLRGFQCRKLTEKFFGFGEEIFGEGPHGIDGIGEGDTDNFGSS